MFHVLQHVLVLRKIGIEICRGSPDEQPVLQHSTHVSSFSPTSGSCVPVETYPARYDTVQQTSILGIACTFSFPQSAAAEMGFFGRPMLPDEVQGD